MPMNPPPQLDTPGKFGIFDGRILSPSDVAALITLRSEVRAELSDPDLYVNEDDEEGFLRKLCGESGQTYGVFDGERLVAYGSVGFPLADDEDNLGILLGLDGAGCAQIAHIASCMVLPSHRGHALQRSLLRARFALAVATGRRHAIAMVSLKNDASRHNMLRQGMRVRWVGTLCHGLRRQLLVRDLLAPPDEGVRPTESLLASSDYEAQIAAIAAGLEGWQDHHEDGRSVIAFRSRS